MASSKGAARVDRCLIEFCDQLLTTFMAATQQALMVAPDYLILGEWFLKPTSILMVL